ncbi:4Fe-4S dicluster domain-containing protein [uncultured Adlercreutzia sp.]|uniref:4Fe-4S dicluster domain-containing protein n=1 Tax=uncultured Adlercreutzia sp. TaxID=875803 RepID=UPI0025EDDCA1|nr:4Fe-4S dicluster domain-containing protein [uncultured Adlercreutzia sp.]
MADEKKVAAVEETAAAPDPASADVVADPTMENVDTAEAKRAGKGGITRRGLFIGVGSTVALMGLGALRYAGHNPLNHPPGGQDEAHLVSACIRCERCYEACPRQAIVPAKIEDGLLGMRAPMLDFNTGNYCDFCYEENGGTPKCVEVCPTCALELPADYQVGNPESGETGNVIIGLAEIDPRTCLAYRLTGCRDCYDACNYGAIELKDEGGANPIPYVVEDRCNGCGACQAVCLSLSSGSIKSTERAIVVRPIEA